MIDLKAATTFISALTFKKVLLIGLLVVIAVIGYVGYFLAPRSETYFIGYKTTQLKSLSINSEGQIRAFMNRYRDSVIYFTVIGFDFPLNRRVPIHRAFNDPDMEKLMAEKLRANNGVLPIFIKGQMANNDQMIAIMQGEFFCDSFSNAALAKAFPDVTFKFPIVTTCRAPIPPAFGNGARGYLIAYLTKEPNQFDFNALQLDLLKLARDINDNN